MKKSSEVLAKLASIKNLHKFSHQRTLNCDFFYCNGNPVSCRLEIVNEYGLRVRIGNDRLEKEMLDQMEMINRLFTKMRGQLTRDFDGEFEMYEAQLVKLEAQRYDALNECHEAALAKAMEFEASKKVETVELEDEDELEVAAVEVAPEEVKPVEISCTKQVKEVAAVAVACKNNNNNIKFAEGVSVKVVACEICKAETEVSEPEVSAEVAGKLVEFEKNLARELEDISAGDYDEAERKRLIKNAKSRAWHAAKRVKVAAGLSKPFNRKNKTSGADKAKREKLAKDVRYIKFNAGQKIFKAKSEMLRALAKVEEDLASAVDFASYDECDGHEFSASERRGKISQARAEYKAAKFAARAAYKTRRENIKAEAEKLIAERVAMDEAKNIAAAVENLPVENNSDAAKNITSEAKVELNEQKITPEVAKVEVNEKKSRLAKIQPENKPLVFDDDDEAEAGENFTQPNDFSAAGDYDPTGDEWAEIDEALAAADI